MRAAIEIIGGGEDDIYDFNSGKSCHYSGILGSET
jgi:hypothetical protein